MRPDFLRVPFADRLLEPAPRREHVVDRSVVLRRPEVLVLRAAVVQHLDLDTRVRGVSLEWSADADAVVGVRRQPEVEPEIRLGIPAYFPDDYIPDANQRLYFYKRLASLKQPRELDDLREEIKDRFGPYGAVVENLFLVMELRRVLKQFLVRQISVSEGRVFLLFHPESPVKVEKLLELIKKQPARFRLSPEGRLSLEPEQQEWEPLVGEIIQWLHTLVDLPPQHAVAAERLPG
jgi:hypothetical protein